MPGCQCLVVSAWLSVPGLLLPEEEDRLLPEEEDLLCPEEEEDLLLLPEEEDDLLLMTLHLHGQARPPLPPLPPVTEVTGNHKKAFSW